MDESLPELRTDWLTGRSVIVAERRALRPNEFDAPPRSVAPDVPSGPSCPFCAGNESRTPRAVYARLDDNGQWQVRIVSNKFPAVTLAADAPLAPASPAVGAHEVIIETARHVDRTSALTVGEYRRVLEAYADRLRHWREDGRLAYGLVFKNQGRRAGASIAHLHSQLVGLPAVPPAAEAELRRAEEAYATGARCPYCALVEQERAAGERIVLDQDGFVAFCPYASLQPHEVWLLPAGHEPSFELAAMPDALDRLAEVLHPLIARVEASLPDGACNILLRTAPWIAPADKWCHWRIELIPRPNAIAGLEIATGLSINPLPPERAARQLRTS